MRKYGILYEDLQMLFTVFMDFVSIKKCKLSIKEYFKMN